MVGPTHAPANVRIQLFDDDEEELRLSEVKEEAAPPRPRSGRKLSVVKQERLDRLVGEEQDADNGQNAPVPRHQRGKSGRGKSERGKPESAARQREGRGAGRAAARKVPGKATCCGSKALDCGSSSGRATSPSRGETGGGAAGARGASTSSPARRSSCSEVTRKGQAPYPRVLESLEDQDDPSPTATRHFQMPKEMPPSQPPAAASQAAAREYDFHRRKPLSPSKAGGPNRGWEEWS